MVLCGLVHADGDALLVLEHGAAGRVEEVNQDGLTLPPREVVTHVVGGPGCGIQNDRKCAHLASFGSFPGSQTDWIALRNQVFRKMDITFSEPSISDLSAMEPCLTFSSYDP